MPPTQLLPRVTGKPASSAPTSEPGTIGSTSGAAHLASRSDSCFRLAREQNEE
jgi:hypothetical protein